MISPAEPSKILKNHGHRLSNENCRHCYYLPQTSQPRGQKRGGLVPKVSLLVMVDLACVQTSPISFVQQRK